MVLANENFDINQPFLSRDDSDENKSDKPGPRSLNSSFWDKIYWKIFDTRAYLEAETAKSRSNFRQWWGLVDHHISSQPRIVAGLLPEKGDPELFGDLGFTLAVELKQLVSKRSFGAFTFNSRAVRRSGADYFVAFLGQNYELLIYTDEPFRKSAFAVAMLDPGRALIKYNLFQEQCRWVHGVWVKQLKHLNRDLAKVIMLDSDPNRSDSPENVLVLPNWDGRSFVDTTLIDLVPFFQDLAFQNPIDVRSSIAKMNECPQYWEEYKLQRLSTSTTNDIPDSMSDLLDLAFQNEDDDTHEESTSEEQDLFDELEDFTEDPLAELTDFEIQAETTEDNLRDIYDD